MEISEARQLSMFLCREIMGTSLSGIGLFFGGRDHTTVMHAIKKISEKIEKNNNIKKTVATIRKEFNQPI